MSFLKPPKPPTVPPPPTPAANPIIAKSDTTPGDPFTSPGSLISTSAEGLKRKASTAKVSLIGG